MSNAARVLQEAAVTSLEAHPALSNVLTGIYDGPEKRAKYPYIAFSDGEISPWGSKTEDGREIRLAINIWDDGEQPARLHDLLGHAEDALAALPDIIFGWQIVSNIFLRSIIARDATGPWSGLIEYRVRMLKI